MAFYWRHLGLIHGIKRKAGMALLG
jgi:hypothetical protein